MLQQTLVLAAALSAGLLTMVLASRTDFAFSRAPGAVVAGYLGRAEGNAFEQVGGAALNRFPALGGLVDVEAHRRWLLLVGAAPSAAAVWGLAIVLGGLGLLLPAVTGAPALVAAALVGAVAPFARLRSQGNAVRRRVQRSLPDLAALMAAEMSAGNPPDRALARAAEFGGPLGNLLRRAVEEARTSGRPLFGREDVAGVLVEVVSRYDLPPVKAFAAQIDQAARTGVAGPELMAGLARTLIIAYKDRSLREAEALESRLAIPTVLFFFLPFMFLILVPLLLPVINAL